MALRLSALRGIFLWEFSMATYDDTNIFARILRGEIPCKKIYEDEFVLAFHDITPQAPVHALVIPKGNYTSFADFGATASPAQITGFFRAVALVAKQLGVEESGYRLISNAGPDSQQSVAHFHMHILGGRPLSIELEPAPK
jgi:diadenosine tetraphosphate (Ap4A) HIT family hydrolase